MVLRGGSLELFDGPVAQPQPPKRFKAKAIPKNANGIDFISASSNQILDSSIPILDSSNLSPSSFDVCREKAKGNLLILY